MFFKRRDNLPVDITSYDILKSITVIFMLIDHIGAYFFTGEEWWRTLGRFGFPVWFFLAGYALHKEIDKPLWAGALILIVGNLVLGQYSFPANALVSIIVVKLLIDKLGKFAFSGFENLIYLSFLLILLGHHSNYAFEYGTLAILLGLFGYSVRHADELDIARWVRILFSIFVVTAITAFQIYEFNLNAVQSSVWACGMAMFSLIFYFFKPITFPKISSVIPRFLKLLIQFMGRYTLEIYVIHLLLIKAMVLYLHYGHYTLFNPTIYPNFPYLTP
jgi:hypothetical protein